MPPLKPILFILLIITSALSTRHKRYTVRSKQWEQSHFTWRLDPKLITRSDTHIVRDTLHKAFGTWAAVCGATFEEVPYEYVDADLTVSFERRHHYDNFPFDGKDGVVAHAFFPRDGRLHLDADEDWSLHSSHGVNLYQTAVHEIGHLLGIEHSDDERAVMHPAKRPFDSRFALAADDIRAARILFPLRKAIQHTLIELPVGKEGEKGETTSLSPTTTSFFSDTATVTEDVPVVAVQEDEAPSVFRAVTDPPSTAAAFFELDVSSLRRSITVHSPLRTPSRVATSSSTKQRKVLPPKRKHLSVFAESVERVEEAVRRLRQARSLSSP